MDQHDRQRFAVLLTLLGLVTAIFLGRVMLGGTGDASGPAQFSKQPSEKATTKHAARHGAKSRSIRGGVLAAETFEVFATRDPFEPPVNVTPTTEPPVTTPTTSPTGSTTPTTSPTGSTTPTTSPTGSTTPTTQTPSFTPGTGESVAVLDVFNDASGVPQARVRVGSTVYTVGVGDTFATSYKVVSLNEPCGQFLFGDNPFSLCEGEETIK
jgi:hypothetical protein